MLNSTPRLRHWLLIVTVLWLQACAVARLDDNLPYGVLDNNDLALVGEGLPTYLLLVDGMIINWPESESLLRSGASLYSAYAGLYVSDPERAARLTDKAMDYARGAACASEADLCDVRGLDLDTLSEVLAGMGKNDLPTLFVLGSTWVGYIQQNSGDWNAIADLGRVEAIMNRVVAIDESYEFGQAHMYLGALKSILPASLGGQPEKARVHFEKAIALSDGRNLLAKTLFAEKYARLTFDQALHDQLLEDVLAADSEVHGLTLQNEYAKQEARRLLASSADYFE